MKKVLNERGGVKNLLYLLLIIALVYVGFKFAPPYYKYYAFKSEVRQIARLGEGKKERMKGMLYETSKDIGLNIKKNDIKVFVKDVNEPVTVRIKWHETVNLLDRYKKRLDFSIDITQ